MNYGELKTSIANHIHRTDLTTIIPDFILFAESTIAGDPNPDDMAVMPGIRVRDQIKRFTAIINTEYVYTPTDMLSIKDIQINTDPKTYIEYLTPANLTNKFPSSTTGTPEYFTIHGDEFQFKPVPSGDLTLEISYIQKYAALSADTDTNNILTDHPLAYVYAAMVAASAYVQDDPTQWAAMYKTVAKGINGALDKDQYPSRISTKISTSTP